MLALITGLLLLQSASSTSAVETPGRIAGRVLIRGESTPVSNARVMLMPTRRGPLPPNALPPAPPPQLLTGPDGTFVFDRVPPGEYRVSAQKVGLAEGLPVIQQAPTVVVEAGQTVQVVDILLDRGGAISGRVVDANGEPLVDVRVAAMGERPLPPALLARGVKPPPGIPPLMPAGHAGQTNDLGEFRIFGLLPGDYVVGASGQTNPFATSTSPTTLMTTYYPGVTDQKSAAPVTVGVGQTTGGIEIRMATSAAYLIAGVVVDGGGLPLEGAMVSATSSSGLPLGAHGLSRSDARGRFQIGGLIDGTYRVGVASSSSGPGATMHLPQPATVTVSGGNVTGVRLVLVPK
jgi:hypothetical protein